MTNKLKGMVTRAKRMALYRLFPSGKIRGKSISRMSAKQVHAIYNSLHDSGINMKVPYVSKQKKGYVPDQYSLFDPTYDPLAN